jgi:hypothetical protein
LDDREYFALMGLLLVVAVLMEFKRGADARTLDGDSADRGKKESPAKRPDSLRKKAREAPKRRSRSRINI